MSGRNGRALVRARIVAISRTLTGLLVVAAALTLAPQPSAAAGTYTAVTSGNWENPATWGGVVPAHDGNIMIPDGIAVTITSGVGVVLNHATLTNAGFLFVAGILTLDDGTTVQTPASGELWLFGGTMQLSSGSVGVTADQARINNAGKLMNSGGVIDLGVWTELINTGTVYNDGEFSEAIRAEVHNRGTFENVGHVEMFHVSGSNGPIPAWFFNEGGTFDNSDSLAVVTMGGTFTNSTYGFNNGHVINRGTIDVDGSTGHHGALGNVGAGAPVIDNYGVITVDTNLVNNYSSGNLIHNHAGAQLTLSGNDVHNLSGTLRNDNGATITIVGPLGTVDNRAVIDNDGLISNSGVLSNLGVIRQRCNGIINGNPPTGNALQDWCDSTPPTLNVLSSRTVEATGPTGAIAYFSTTATDDKDPNPAVSCAPSSGSTFPLGATTVSCTATDRVGNSSSGSFTVTVVDTTAPVVAVLGDTSVIVVLHNGYADGGATSSDLVDGDLTSSIEVTSTVDIDAVGTYSVTYAVEDAAGNPASVSRTVTVISALEATQRLSDDIGAMDLATRDDSDLRRPLLRVVELLGDGTASNDTGACRLLTTFRDAVNRKARNGVLTHEEAAGLLDRTNEIRTAIGC
jgi:hypothetical protein